MGLLTDLWNKFSEFFQIEVAEPIVPKEPPKPLEPKEHVTTLPEKPIAEIEVEPIEPLPPVEIIEPVPIGEQGRADRIKVLPAKEEPFTEPPSVEDYPCTMTFQVNGQKAGTVDVGGGLVVGGLADASVTFNGATATTDKLGQCTIKTTAKIRKLYNTTVSKAGYKTQTKEIAWAFPPRSGYLSDKQFFNMELL